MGRAAAVAGSLVAAILVAEAVARLSTGFDAASAAAERAAFLARLPGQAPGIADDDDPEVPVRRAYGAGYELHPYYGYTFRRSTSGSNNQGFFAGGRDYPYVKAPGELTLGIFGGSVAMQLAAAPEPLLERLRPALAAKGYREIVVLPFAAGGWRQPQTFAALAHNLRSLDLAVNLDGFNEVIFLYDDLLSFYPATFPWSQVYASLVHESTDPDDVLRRAKLIAANRLAAAATRLADRPVLRRSALAHAAWQASVAAHARTADGLRREEREATAERFRGIETGSPSEARSAYLDRVADLLRWSDLLCRQAGCAFFHFVQPNQYLRDSKPWSEEERAERLGNGWADTVTPGYGRLAEISAALRREGVESHFLGRIFEATPETVYSDDCCHLNERGVAMVAAAIGERIAGSPGFGAIPPAAEVRRASP